MNGRTWIISILIFCFAAGCSKDSNGSSGNEPDPHWELVWSDEFDATGLPDPAKWGYDVGGSGWGNNELQYYTENNPNNARVMNGRLIIEAHRENFGGNEYTSARLVTRGKGDWIFGRFEINAKLPSGRGTWPAIWMLPTQWSYGNGGWPDNGEIDIMEHVGYDPGVIHASIHTHLYNWPAGTQKTAIINIPDAETAFHTYTLEWSGRPSRRSSKKDHPQRPPRTPRAARDRREESAQAEARLRLWRGGRGAHEETPPPAATPPGRREQYGDSSVT